MKKHNGKKLLAVLLVIMLAVPAAAIVALQEAKRDLAEAIISGESNSLMSMSREELMALLE